MVTPLKKGYTLVELVVVLAIVTIFLGILVPRLDGLFAKEQLESVVYQMHSDLRWAQQMAQTRNSEFTIFACYRDGPGRCFYVISQTDGAEMVERKRVTLPKRVQVDFTTNTTVTFKSDGTIVKNGHLGLTGGEESWYIYFYLTGRMRISEKLI